MKMTGEILGLTIAAFLLIGVHCANVLVGTPSWQLERLFHLGLETNIPTWFSSLLWALAAVAAFECSWMAPSQGERRIWKGTAAGLLLLSIDEVAIMHESFADALQRHFFPAGIFHHFRASVWPVLFAPLVVCGIAGATATLWHLLKKSPRARARVLAGIAMVAVGGWLIEATLNFLNHGSLEWLWRVEIVLEESLEMFGVIVLLSGLLLHQELLRKSSRMRGAFKPLHDPRLIRVLCVTALFLVAIEGVSFMSRGTSWQLERLFDFSQEDNVSTWFSSVLFALAGFAAYECAQAVSLQRERRFWQFMGSGLFLFSIDDVAMMHENFSDIFRKYVLNADWAWKKMLLFSFGFFAALLAAGSFIFLVRSLKGSRRAGALMFLGIVILAGERVLDATEKFLQDPSLEWLLHIESVGEGVLKMFGTIVLLSGLLVHQAFLRKQSRAAESTVNEKFLVGSIS